MSDPIVRITGDTFKEAALRRGVVLTDSVADNLVLRLDDLMHSRGYEALRARAGVEIILDWMALDVEG